MRRMRAVVLVLTALLSPLAMALGLGALETRSSLNEPFEARISFTGSSVKDFDTLKARLADTTQFARAGIPRESVLLMLRFEVVADEPGAEYLRIRSLDPVREPYLNFLIELDWANGRIVREYTVLLDPPEYAQGRPAGVAAPVTAAGPALVAALPASATVAATPAPAALPAPTSPSTPAVAPPADAATGQITVPPGATAWELALDYRPDRTVSVHLMIMALVRANPEAFVGGNVNRLRRGVVLRLPEPAEISALDRPAATAEFERQAEAWQALRQQQATPVPVPAATPESAVAATAPAESTTPAEPTAGDADTEVADLEAIIEEAVEESVEEAAADAAKEAASADVATDAALAADETAQTPPDALEDALEREARLELSAPETQEASEAPGNDAEGTADPALAMESADVSARENAELEARLTEAEQIIDLLQRQLKVKDEELAALQAKAERARAAPPPEPETVGMLDSLVPEALRDALPGGAATVVGILVLLIVLPALLIQRAAASRRTLSLPAPGGHPVQTSLEPEIPEIDLSLDQTRAEAARGSLADLADELDLSLEDTSEFPPTGGYPETTLPAPETTVGESLADITRSMEASIASLDVDDEGDSVLSLSLEPDEEGGDIELDFTLGDAGSSPMVDTMALDPDALRKSAEARNRAELALQGEEEESSPLHQTDTKLNLARAYIELGDADGARQILEEVLQTGNATQLEEARRLMTQIA